jgi:hypothetical protein
MARPATGCVLLTGDNKNWVLLSSMAAGGAAACKALEVGSPVKEDVVLVGSHDADERDEATDDGALLAAEVGSDGSEVPYWNKDEYEGVGDKEAAALVEDNSVGEKMLALALLLAPEYALAERESTTGDKSADTSCDAVARPAATAAPAMPLWPNVTAAVTGTGGTLAEATLLVLTLA